MSTCSKPTTSYKIYRSHKLCFLLLDLSMFLLLWIKIVLFFVSWLVYHFSFRNNNLKMFIHFFMQAVLGSGCLTVGLHPLNDGVIYLGQKDNVLD